MIKNITGRGVLVAVSAFAFSAIATNVAAQDKSGYVQDTRAGIVKTPFGLCVRTGFWSPAMAVAECDPDLVPKPAPKPAPPPAARGE